MVTLWAAVCSENYDTKHFRIESGSHVVEVYRDVIIMDGTRPIDYTDNTEPYDDMSQFRGELELRLGEWFNTYHYLVDDEWDIQQFLTDSINSTTTKRCSVGGMLWYYAIDSNGLTGMWFPDYKNGYLRDANGVTLLCFMESDGHFTLMSNGEFDMSHFSKKQVTVTSTDNIEDVLLEMCQNVNVRGYKEACALIGNALKVVSGNDIGKLTDSLKRNFT